MSTTVPQVSHEGEDDNLCFCSLTSQAVLGKKKRVGSLFTAYHVTHHSPHTYSKLKSFCPLYSKIKIRQVIFRALKTRLICGAPR